MTRTTRARLAPAPARRTPDLRVLLGLGALLTAVVAAPAGASAPRAADWHGSTEAKPSAYRWLNDYRPADTYAITIIRGLTVHQVRHRLGPTRQRLGALTPRAADNFALEHSTRSFAPASVVQVQQLGPAVVVYQPAGMARAFFKARRISRHALLAAFITDIELDTSVEVARHGRIIRSFDPLFRPPRQGALPQEKGLPFGVPKVDVWDTSWAFLERVTRIHLSHEWFGGTHRTYWLWGRRH
jgi:hypothetical protein